MVEADSLSEVRNNAKAQTWKKQSGSLGHRARLHGNELWLRPAERKQEMISLIRTAVERGVTFFDTAEVTARSRTKNSWAKPSLRSASEW